MHRLRTTAPSRAIVIISTLVVALVLLLASRVGASGDPAAATEVYTVRSGDTLWEIAAERTSASGDVRATVADIRATNGIQGSLIQVGQRLEVPAG